MTDPMTQQKIAAWRAGLTARGETLTSFCRQHGLDLDAMYKVIAGRTKGQFGMAHKIYVAIGIKPNIPQQTNA